MNFLVLAYDGTDPEAQNRRQAARAQHLERVQAMLKLGKIINGGAILNESGDMIGTTFYVDFASRQELDDWLKSDAYVTGGVWVDINIRPLKLVPASVV